MANKINLLIVIFLLISFSTIYNYRIIPSFGQISLVPDNSLIAQTSDCITSMMTSALIGVNSDCSDALSKQTNSTTPDKNSDVKSISPESSSSDVDNPVQNNNPYNLSKNNPFYHEFQTQTIDENNNTYSTTFKTNSLNIVDGNVVDGNNPTSSLTETTTTTTTTGDNVMSPPPEKPSTFVESISQSNFNKPVAGTYNIQTSSSSSSSSSSPPPLYIAAPTNSELSKSVEGKNKHSEEISACFDRAFRIDNYLSDAEIIQCAEDRDSFSSENIQNIAKNISIKNNYNDGKTDNKHSEEISACFDRAFRIDNYLSDAEIIQCAEDRDSFE